MKYLKKIVRRDELSDRVAKLRSSGQRIVQCHGVFDILHPGHLRHLAWARQRGDALVVTIAGDEAIRLTGKSTSIPEHLRAEHLAAVEMVDLVCVEDDLSALAALADVQPDAFVRGREFEDASDDVSQSELAEVEKHGGRVLYSSGEVDYTLERASAAQPSRTVASALTTYCERHGITASGVHERLDSFPSRKILVIGEAIVDEYVHCDPLGMSADSPTIVVRPDHSIRYLGGAGIVARHVASLGAEARFVSVIGDDEPGRYAREELDKADLTHELVVDPNRPTVHKKRYIASRKKLLNANTFSDREVDRSVESQLLRQVERLAADVDAIIISDFSYGVITDAVLECVTSFAEKGVIVVGDVQCSSQIGDVTRIRRAAATTPSEREARISMWDRESGVADLGVMMLQKTRNRSLVMTLGPNGLMVVDTGGNPGRQSGSLGDRLDESVPLHELKRQLTIDYLPSFASVVVDSMGAGDALLATLSTSLAAGAPILEAAYLGNCAAAIAVSCMGNVPVDREALSLTVHEHHNDGCL